MKEIDDNFMSEMTTLRHVPTWLISQMLRENIRTSGADVNAMDDVTSAAYHAVQSARFLPHLGYNGPEIKGWSQERVWSMVCEIFSAWGPTVYRLPNGEDEEMQMAKLKVSGNNLLYASMEPYHYLFLLAAYQGEHGFLNHLLQNQIGLDVNFFHSSLGDALFLASYKGDICTIQLLLEHGYNINHGGDDLSRSLEHMIHTGRLDILRLIVPRMRYLHDCGCGQPLLFCAVNQQDQNMLRLVLDNLPGVKDAFACNQRNIIWHRYTPLEYAIAKGLPDHIVKVFLESENIDPNIGATQPLRQAISKNRLSVVKMLLQHPRINLKGDTARGKTPLSSAANCGSLEYVELLIRHGSFGVQDLRVPIENCCANPGDAVHIIRLLYERYPAIRPYFSDPGSGEWLLLATKNRNADIVKFLVRNGANLNYASDWQNPLIIAILAGSRNIVDFLMHRADVDVNVATETLTPLTAAIAVGDYRIVKILLQRPDIIVNPRSDRLLPLPRALTDPRPSITSLLLDHPDVDVNRMDEFGFTPIQLAVKRDQPEHVQLLFDRGARLDVNVDRWGPIMERARTMRWMRTSAVFSDVAEGRRLLQGSSTA